MYSKMNFYIHTHIHPCIITLGVSNYQLQKALKKIMEFVFLGAKLCSYFCTATKGF